MSDLIHEVTEEFSASWAADLFERLAEGGTWGVPRSGLIFSKAAERLLLVARMPWAEGMPITAEQLAAQQDADFDAIREVFEGVGVTVEEEL